MLQHMSASEHRTWQVLALIEGQAEQLRADGMDAETAERMAWALPERENEDDEC